MHTQCAAKLNTVFPDPDTTKDKFQNYSSSNIHQLPEVVIVLRCEKGENSSSKAKRRAERSKNFTVLLYIVSSCLQFTE